MSYSNYGVYLIPPPQLVHSIAQAHQVLASEYNAQVGGRFMVHCTVKGFFKLREGATPADFTPGLTALFGRTPAFPTAINEVKVLDYGPQRVSIFLELERSEAFSQFQVALWEVLRPFIDPDCPFMALDGYGPNFRPHITLVQYDGPHESGLLTQLTDLCQYWFNTSFKGPFQACDMQLIEFQSEDWANEWWHSLTYRQLNGWRLAEPPMR